MKIERSVLKRTCYEMRVVLLGDRVDIEERLCWFAVWFCVSKDK